MRAVAREIHPPRQLRLLALLLGSVAGAGPLSGFAAAEQKLMLLWIEVGKDDFLLKRNEEFLASLKDEGVHHERHLTEGNPGRPGGRPDLAEFVPELFQ